jgi:hypothetical protein
MEVIKIKKGEGDKMKQKEYLPLEEARKHVGDIDPEIILHPTAWNCSEPRKSPHDHVDLLPIHTEPAFKFSRDCSRMKTLGNWGVGAILAACAIIASPLIVWLVTKQ